MDSGRNSFENMESDLARRNRCVIYGAGIIAYGAFTAVKELYGIEPAGFVVTKRDSGRLSYGGVPILEAEEAVRSGFFDKTLIIVAAPEIYHTEIRRSLEEYLKYGEIYFLDAHMEYCLMSRYFRKKGQLVLLEDLKKQKQASFDGRPAVGQTADKYAGNGRKLSVYMAKSHNDKKLAGQYRVPEWIIPVQAGKKCTEQTIAGLSDAEGDNISHKNPDYCELTVTYWAWKNRHSPYKGVCHYRRKLLLDVKDIRSIGENDIDLVLPLPFVCYPNATGQYGRYVSVEDRKALERALEDVSPDDIAVLREVDGQNLYYDFNMLIAKERIFDEYAEWMFSILFQAEKYCAPEGQIRGDRYAGYLGELLTTIYIFKNRNRYRIVHAERDWAV